MKLEKFKEKNPKKRIIMLSIGGVILLLAGIYLYRTFAIFEENREFNIIKGQIPNQKYDVMLSYYTEDNNGVRTFSEYMPQDRDFEVSIECEGNQGQESYWDYAEWAPVIKNVYESRTKCSLIFKKAKTLIQTIQSLPKVTSGDGLYEVGHSNANITYTTNTTAINNLKQTELRYAGSNPNNYVQFDSASNIADNKEAINTFRMVGIVNTPEGQRIKVMPIISHFESSFSKIYDAVNSSMGTNNVFYSILFIGGNPAFFEDAYISRRFLDSKTITLGAKPVGTSNLIPNEWYNVERGNSTGKACSTGTLCNDGGTRELSTYSSYGLLYPSDYGYSTSERSCLSSAMNIWNANCYNASWLRNYRGDYSLTAIADSTSSYLVSSLSGGSIPAREFRKIVPVYFLHPDVYVGGGNGSFDLPYILYVR